MEYFDKVTELSRRLTEWSMQSGHKLAQARTYTGVTRYHLKTRGPPKQSYSVIDEDVKGHPGACVCSAWLGFGGRLVGWFVERCMSCLD